MPVRLQRKRTKGYRLPEGAVYVGRPGKFGNPFADVNWGQWDKAARFESWLRARVPWPQCSLSQRYSMTPLGQRFDEIARALPELRGKDLVCWCPLGQPCHADTLLELANA